MRAARFFVDVPLASNTRIELPTRVAHHATRVLRLHDRDSIVVFNGAGGEFAGTLALSGLRAFADVGAFDAVERESRLQITLVQSWIANEKLDWAVEKSVELGVHSIVLAPTQRSVVRIGGDRLTKRLQRLRELAVGACAQCGRNRIPDISAEPTMSAALQVGRHNDTVGVLLAPSTERGLTDIELQRGRVALAVGPEGGFSDDEVASARDLGYQARRLGPRVLRTETAGMAAIVAMQALAGDLA